MKNKNKIYNIKAKATLKYFTDIWIFKEDAIKRLEAAYLNFCGNYWVLQDKTLIKYRLDKK
jgi:hypothetical protein